MYEKFLEYILKCDPFAKEIDISKIIEINEWDLLIVFKDGRRFIVDRFTGYQRNLFYNSLDELTEEQERREFGRALRRMMQRKCVSQEELANRINTSQTMISHYMTGRCIPNMIMGRKIAKVLNCSLDELFYIDYNEYLKV